MPKRFLFAVLRADPLIVLMALCLCGCGPGKKSADSLTFRQLAARLADPLSLARLDLPETSLLSSFDPTGGNSDYNHPLRPGPPGWWVIADLKGPGYVSRFWFTGGDPNHGIRLYFDNEKSPRYDTTISRFCGQQEPFLPPLAAHENFCWYNYVPLPYARRLLVMVQAGATKPGGWPRIFHQINYSSLPPGTRIETFPRKLSAGENLALQSVRSAWNNPSACIPADGMATQAVISELPAGQSRALPRIAGPAMIREIRVTPAALDGQPPDWGSLLRNVILRIRWDDAAFASVESPLGDFCGNVWRRAQYQSMYFGLDQDTLVARFPMPFASAAELSFENQSTNALVLRVETESAPVVWNGHSGYFHAAWRRSTPQDVGRPHEVLETHGRGRYAGCILSAVTLDKSFWMLEGDEIMWRDGETAPFWQGTGLEDYFNGGWYYQNVLARPLHGLPFKTFFRTVQYRLHLPDPVMFQKAFRMIFERGPDNASNGWLESVAWYYLDKPAPAPATILSSAERLPPEDQFGQATIMPELWNYERFWDYAGAHGFIDSFLVKYPGFPFIGVLRLRQAAYSEKIEGFAAVRPQYEKILATATNALVQQQARLLLWFHEKPTHVLAGVYCNTPARIYMDGRLIGEAGSPERMAVFGLDLRPGRHVLALQCRHHPYPTWVQAYVRAHSGDVWTTTDWKHSVQPAGAWTQPDYDDSGWAAVGGTGCKGPPEEPYVWVEPNAFVDMQSRAVGIWSTIDWSQTSKPVCFRREFEVKSVNAGLRPQPGITAAQRSAAILDAQQ